MWQKFTERSRRVVFFAQEEAGRLGQVDVDTEHLLLGIVREKSCVAMYMLEKMGVTGAQIRAEIERRTKPTESLPGQPVDRQLTPSAKRALDFAQEFANEKNSPSSNGFIGAEHLLLGLLREADGLAAQVLVDLGIELERTRHRVLKLAEGDAFESAQPNMSYLDSVMQRLEQEDPDLYDATAEAELDRLERKLAGNNGTASDFAADTLPKISVDNREWDRFTVRALRTVKIAQEEAIRLSRPVIETEHLLAGLLIQSDSMAVRLLDRMVVNAGRIRMALDRLTDFGNVVPEETPLSASASDAIGFAYQEARQLNNDYVGTEHLLIGLIREPAGFAGRLLTAAGADLIRTRDALRALSPATAAPTDPKQTTHRTNMIDYLLAKGYATDEQIAGVREIHIPTKTNLRKICISLGIDPTFVYEASAQELGQPFIDLRFYEPNREALDALPAPIAVRYNVLPVKKDGDILYVAMGDLNDVAARVRMRVATNCSVRGILAVPERITAAIALYYPGAGEAAQKQGLEQSELQALLESGGALWHGRSLVSLFDVSSAQIDAVLNVAACFKGLKKKTCYFSYPKTLALLFEKPSLRTRVSFEAGMEHLAGHAIYLAPADVGLGVRESVADVAACLSRWVNLIAARTFQHETVEELAVNATVPVINALSDREHPIQAFADLLTIIEWKGGLGNHLKLAYVGDGYNVLHALLLACAKVGVNLTAACPQGYQPNLAYVAEAQRIGAGQGETGARIEIVTDPVAAVRDADVVYTDIWTNMGQEAETAERLKIFPPYQVNAALLQHAKPDVIVLHCLPAHHEEEIAADVMAAHKPTILDQAENRLHTQKALIALMLGLKPDPHYTQGK